MTREEKDLLLKDLSARLSYGTKVNVVPVPGENISFNAKIVCVDVDYMGVLSDDGFFFQRDYEIKPYLFPLSSMTEEQKEDFYKIFEEGTTGAVNETKQWLRTKKADETRRPITIAYVMVHELVIDWLNKNHFDYRGLIEKGLAIDATGLNIY